MYLLPLILFVIIAIGMLIAIYLLPPFLTKKDVIFTSVSEGHIAAISNIENSGAPEKFFSSELSDAERVSLNGKIFDPTSSALPFLKEVLGQRGTFELGLPKYKIRTRFPEIKIPEVQVTRTGEDNKYSLTERNICTRNQTEIPAKFTFGVIADNIELIDGSQVDVFLNITLKLVDVRTFIAMIVNNQLAKLTQDLIAGQVNDYLKSGDSGVKNYSEVQVWRPNQNTPGNELFEILEALNAKIPGYEGGFERLLGVKVTAVSVIGVEGSSDLVEAARQKALETALGEAEVAKAEAQAKVTKITAEADALAISLRGNAEAEVRLKKVEALAAKGDFLAAQQALSELKNLTTYAPGKDMHMSIDVDKDSSKKDSSEKK